MSQTHTDRDLWQIARIGGNELRRRTADLITRQQDIPDELLRWVEQDAVSLASGESYLTGVGQYHEPWSFTGVGETEVTSHPASYTGPTHVHSPRRFDQKLPESAFDWPIYRAAVLAQVVVTVSGGNVNTFLDRGDVSTIEIDWDQYEEGGLLDYEREDLTSKREELSGIEDPQLREELLERMDEVIEMFDDLARESGR